MARGVASGGRILPSPGGAPFDGASNDAARAPDIAFADIREISLRAITTRPAQKQKPRPEPGPELFHARALPSLRREETQGRTVADPAGATVTPAGGHETDKNASRWRPLARASGTRFF